MVEVEIIEQCHLQEVDLEVVAPADQYSKDGGYRQVLVVVREARIVQKVEIKVVDAVEAATTAIPIHRSPIEVEATSAGEIAARAQTEAGLQIETIDMIRKDHTLTVDHVLLK